MTINKFNKRLTLLEVINRQDPNGNSASIIEVLNQTNTILQDAPWKEANGSTVHTVKRRSSLGDGTSGTRRFNEGVGTTQSTVSSYKVGLSMFEKRNEADKKMIDMASNRAEERMSEASATIEEMGQNFTNYMLYGDDGDEELGFRGLADELNSLADPRVFGCGGTGVDLTSMFLVQWGEQKTHCVYPKGQPIASSVKHTDLGTILTVEEEDSTNTKKYLKYVDLFEMTGALVIADPRSVARVCNIEITGDPTDPASSHTIDPARIVDAMVQMVNQIGSANMGSGVIGYAPRVVYSQLVNYANSHPGKGFNYTNPFPGNERGLDFAGLSYNGVPIKLVEQISTSETALV